ncbi:MAG: ribonuclease Z [Bacteroidia bacterium]|nr:ribonuclease Z [Bacteroidia bacterium]
MFELTILGSSSATPAFKRHLSAQLVSHNDRLFLIDCGEGTQFQLLRYKVRIQRLDAIFISHLHGDHIFGLPGLLCTLGNHERTRPLTLVCPEGLPEMLSRIFQYSDTRLKFDIEFVELKEKESRVVFENNGLEVETIPLRHRVYCNGFLFREKKRPGKFETIQAMEDGIPRQYFHLLKQGNDIELDGRVIHASDYLGASPKRYAYAYCSDTRYMDTLAQQVQDVDLLYHEATFMEDLKHKAESTFHSTAHEAALVARKAGAQKLVIGHFSARYSDLSPLLQEARMVFPETYLAEEGVPVKIK